MQAVNRIILDKAVSDVELIPKLAHHLIDSGGKRLRPMLTIASAQLCGYTRGGRGRPARPVASARRCGCRGGGRVGWAAAVEFMHTATLLHDDVVDESDVRRGKRAARMLGGKEASGLGGGVRVGQVL